MTDENGQAPQTDTQPSRTEERIIDLSAKVRVEAEARAVSDLKAAEAEKRATFAEGFVDVMAQNPAAKDFKADIQAKVMSGYSVEDATYAVLGKAGKLGVPAPAAPESPAGGSATTAMNGNATKSVSEMTQEERRAQLEKDLAWS
jgi:hypothetical protein